MAIALIPDVVFRMLTLKATRLGATRCAEFHAAGLTKRVAGERTENVDVDSLR